MCWQICLFDCLFVHFCMLVCIFHWDACWFYKIDQLIILQMYIEIYQNRFSFNLFHQNIINDLGTQWQSAVLADTIPDSRSFVIQVSMWDCTILFAPMWCWPVLWRKGFSIIFKSHTISRQHQAAFRRFCLRAERWSQLRSAWCCLLIDWLLKRILNSLYYNTGQHHTREKRWSKPTYWLMKVYLYLSSSSNEKQKKNYFITKLLNYGSTSLP